MCNTHDMPSVKLGLELVSRCIVGVTIAYSLERIKTREFQTYLNIAESTRILPSFAILNIARVMHRYCSLKV